MNCTGIERLLKDCYFED